ncbi:MAG: hypothetical protein QM784_07520 [Polyangiaceae bacterium]
MHVAKPLNDVFQLCRTPCMTVTTKGVRFSAEDVRLLEAVQRMLGCRSSSEVVRMGPEHPEHRSNPKVSREHRRGLRRHHLRPLR